MTIESRPDPWEGGQGETLPGEETPPIKVWKMDVVCSAPVARGEGHPTAKWRRDGRGSPRGPGP